MRLKRSTGLLATAIACAAFPAAAMATHTSPNEDSYFNALSPNGECNVISQCGTAAFPLTEATHLGNSSTFTEGEVLPGSLTEPNDCGGPPYGQTGWYWAFPHVNGIITVDLEGNSAPFDGVISWFRFNRSTGAPVSANYDCRDASNSTAGTESAAFSTKKGEAWAIQIGDFGTGNPHSVHIDFIPDTDADGVYDFNDACPTVAGTLSNGCPAPRPIITPDGDRDGIPDSRDKCRSENSRARDANLNGCLDLRRINAKFRFTPGSYLSRSNRPRGLSVRSLSVRGAPSKARITASCSRKACKTVRTRANSKGRAKLRGLTGRKLKAGVKITIRVTKSGYVGDVRIFKIKRNAFTSADRCTTPGSRKLRKRCSTLR